MGLCFEFAGCAGGYDCQRGSELANPLYQSGRHGGVFRDDTFAYCITAILSYLFHKNRVMTLAHFAAVCTATVVALYFMVDAIDLHPDPQNGIFLFMLPFIQAGIYMAALALFARLWRFLDKRAGYKDRN